jgi:hypothetical protein
MKRAKRFRVTLIAAAAVAAIAVPAAVAGTYLYSGSITTGDVPQTNRLFRDGVRSTCNSSKPNPGDYSTAGSYADVYNLFNPTSQYQCVTVRITPFCGTNYATFVAGYDGYDPADPDWNWLGDEGSSAADGQNDMFQFWADPFSSFQVVVSTVPSNSSTCNYYSLSVAYGKVSKTFGANSAGGAASAQTHAASRAVDHR